MRRLIKSHCLDSLVLWRSALNPDLMLIRRQPDFFPDSEYCIAKTIFMRKTRKLIQMSCLVSKNKALVKGCCSHLQDGNCASVCRLYVLVVVREGLYWGIRGDDSLWETGFHNCPLLSSSLSSLQSTAGSFHAKCQMEDF